MSARSIHDKSLQEHVLDELEFEPSIDSAAIGVAVQDGVVTLSGHVPSYPQKLDAERAAWRVRGVKAVVQKIDVHYGFEPPTDEDLARRASNVLSWDVTVPNSVHIKVVDGYVTLQGEVYWKYQRDSAERALRSLHGIKGILNLITVKPAVQPAKVKDLIVEALKRNAAVEAAAIRVEVRDGGTVTLEGKVDNWAERTAAERAAWSAPGVTKVEDRLAIV